MNLGTTGYQLVAYLNRMFYRFNVLKCLKY